MLYQIIIIPADSLNALWVTFVLTTLRKEFSTAGHGPGQTEWQSWGEDDTCNLNQTYF